MFKLPLVASRFDFRWCSGIASGASFNHSEFCWATRLLPRVNEAFSAVRNPRHTLLKSFMMNALHAQCDAHTLFIGQVWGGERDLIVSFDGGNAFRPWKIKPEWSTDGGWWHVDQV